MRFWIGFFILFCYCIKNPQYAMLIIGILLISSYLFDKYKRLKDIYYTRCEIEEYILKYYPDIKDSLCYDKKVELFKRDFLLQHNIDSDKNICNIRSFLGSFRKK